MHAGTRTLAVDIGGTWIKAMVLDARGRPASAESRTPTPKPATFRAVMSSLRTLAADMPPYHRAAVGFPGVILEGRVRTAANLHPSWIGRALVPAMSAALRVPTRVANDADMQGLAIIEGRGVELVLTLGTGVGSALFLDGRLIPNLELGHHPFERGRTYEERLSDRVLHRIGVRRWKERLMRAVATLQRAFNPRRTYLGGGNARFLKRGLPREVVAVDNVAGVLGGIYLWDEKPRRRERLTRAAAPLRARSRPASSAGARATSRS
jgi:polyphosphate glucokinase